MSQLLTDQGIPMSCSKSQAVKPRVLRAQHLTQAFPRGHQLPQSMAALVYRQNLLSREGVLVGLTSLGFLMLKRTISVSLFLMQKSVFKKNI